MATRSDDDRAIPGEGSVVAADLLAGGGSATPSFGLPAGASSGLPGPLGETRIGPRTFSTSAANRPAQAMRPSMRPRRSAA